MTTDNSKDLYEILEVFLLAGIVTWLLFYTFEVYIPGLAEHNAYYESCESQGGFVLLEQNKEKMCIKKDNIILIP